MLSKHEHNSGKGPVEDLDVSEELLNDVQVSIRSCECYTLTCFTITFFCVRH